MQKIINQLKAQGIEITKLQSIFTAHVPSGYSGEIKLKITESNKLVFAIQPKAQITIVEQWEKIIDKSEVFLSIGSESKVNYVINGAKAVSQQINYQAYLNRESELDLYAYLKTKKDVQANFSIKHQKKASRGQITIGLNIAGKSQSKFNLINHHQGDQTTGDMVLKCLAKNQVRAEINGLIKIDPKAKNTNSYLTENVLLLSPHAEVKAIPNLEILNNEVKASHSATVGRIDQQMIYYLMSRGLDKKKAENLITNGFFSSLVRNIKNTAIKRSFEQIAKQ